MADTTTAAPAEPASGAEDVHWDIDPLVLDVAPNADDPPAAVRQLLDEAATMAADLSNEFKGTLATIDSAGLVELMRRRGEMHDKVGRASNFASLWYTTDTADAARGALQQEVSERLAKLQTEMVWAELEWAELSDERVDDLLADPALDFCAHSLRSDRRYRDHLLSEAEEKVLAEKSVTGRSAWVRLFTDLTSAIEVELDGSTMPLDAALSRLSDNDGGVRKAAAEAVTEALEPGLRTRGYVLNTLAADKATDDRLRGYRSWIQSRNLSNEASDESVQALVDAVVSRYDIPQRWYALKAQVLGVDRIADYDRMASIADEDAFVPWDDAKQIVLDAYRSFSPQMADHAREFFDNGWIDAPPGPGKRGGAFCAYTVPSHHPYVMLNYTSRQSDVLTLAHELGHGLHAYLSRPQGVFHMTTPLTLAETASVFGETVTFERLLDESPEETHFALLAGNIERNIATVFRQTAMNRFEDAVHTHRRDKGELSLDDLGGYWQQTQADMLGDAVEITEGYKTWWSYIPHFIHTPGYVYAYAYGQLLALSVYARYRERGQAFVPQYLELLSAGGSMPPEELGKIVDCDLADPAFWSQGLDLVDEQLKRAEAAAQNAG